MLLDEIEAMARDKENLYHNIATARQAIKDILYFAYGDFPLDLPAAALDLASFGDVPYNHNPRADILALEAGSLTRIFVFEQNPLLDTQRRITILKDILKCCTLAQREFLLHVIRNRTIPGISKNDVAQVFGWGWFKPRAPQPRTTMQKVATRVADTREEYEAFKPLKSLGLVQ